MGDSGGIYGIAKIGGLGIAFNANQALLEFIAGTEENIKENIIIVKEKDLNKVPKILETR